MAITYGVIKLSDDLFMCSIRKNGLTVYNRTFKTLEDATFAYNTVVLQQNLPLPLNKIVKDEQILKCLRRNPLHKNILITYESFKVAGGWSSLLCIGKYRRFIGVYDSPDAAAEAYNNFIILRGIRARLINCYNILDVFIIHNKDVLLGNTKGNLIIGGPPLIYWLKKN